jgi:peptidoglycan/xylan/chitin deacetylase (PgdA/CDA1 family)
MRPYLYSGIVMIVIVALFGGLHNQLHLSAWWLLVPAVVYVHLLVFGAIYIQWNFYLFSYCKGKDKKQVALTFDDGPGTATAAILDILKAQNVPAAFFSIGKNAVANPALVKRWDDEGHLTGNHSYNHGFNFDWQTAGKMTQELTDTNEAIRAITGKTPRLFRPPYGVTNPNVAKAVKRSGMQSIGWNVRSFDTKAKNAQQLKQRILSRLQGGDIVLLHDSMDITREILTELITEARQKGFTFVRVDKLLAIPAYA